MDPYSITVILNSGSTAEEKAKLARAITGSFNEIHGRTQIVTIQNNDDFTQVCETWVKKAKESGGIIVAAGGDGTINLVADVCYRHQVTLGVIPMGTFNYFARELSIPPDINESIKIIASGKIRRVAVGLVQERVFLNNSSFGLYTKLIRLREKASSRFGRARIIAAFAAACSLLDSQKIFSVRVNTDGVEKWHKTAMVFIGNNTIQLENLGMEVAGCTRQDKLAVIIMKEISRLETARLLFRGAIGNLKDEAKLKEFCADHFEVRTSRKSIDLVIDGEIIHCRTPLQFRVEKNALSVIAPAKKENPA